MERGAIGEKMEELWEVNKTKNKEKEGSGGFGFESVERWFAKLVKSNTICLVCAMSSNIQLLLFTVF